MIRTHLAQLIDYLGLAYMNWSLPDSFEASYHTAPSFESVLANTSICQGAVTPAGLTRPGQYTLYIQTTTGTFPTRFKIQPATRPDAPLILFHHGFNEIPYHKSWQRIFRPGQNYTDYHLACVQTLHHTNLLAPMKHGFTSLETVYQMFATSLRVMAYLQNHYQAHGAAYTLATGVSWGGVTSLLYQGIFQQARAVIPLLSGPDLGQVMLDVANLFNRPLTVPLDTISALLDFTPYYQACDPTRVFPLLGQHDLFFRLPHHQATFASHPLTTIPSTHIIGLFHAPAIRQHLNHVLAHCA